jgi:hypothetical protein
MENVTYTTNSGKEFEYEKLKLCPFCGSEAELYAHTLGTFSIACKATDCNYHGDKGVIDDWCSMECETPQCSTVDEAREMWNTRALPPTEGKEILDKVAADLHLTEEEGKDLGSFMSEYFNGLSLPPTEGKEEGCEWVTLHKD